MISCLVDRVGKVYAKDCVHSHSQLAVALGIDEDKCLKYEFDLAKRELVQDFGCAPFEARASHDKAALEFFSECAGTSEKLIEYVERGNWDKDSLLPLLMAPAQLAYDEAKAPAQLAYDEATAPARRAYNEAMASAWLAYNETAKCTWCTLFAKKENRIEVWK